VLLKAEDDAGPIDSRHRRRPTPTNSQLRDGVGADGGSAALLLATTYPINPSRAMSKYLKDLIRIPLARAVP
jgi:hypothetical protein